MSTSTLATIQQLLIRYGMSSYLAIGLIGNICSCLVFGHPSYRRTASSVYFFALSAFAFVYLLWTITPFFFYTVGQPEPQSRSLVYCKLRLYVGHVLGLYVRYVVVFACADRFFASHSAARLRSLTSVRVAQRLILMMCIVCVLIPLHAPILLDIRNGACAMFGVYKLIYACYQIVVVGVVPPTLMCTFSVCTLRALRRRHEVIRRVRRRDRYLFRMLIAEVVVNVVTSIPYSANLMYGAVTHYVTDKSTEQVQTESFISFITTFTAYVLCVAPFYLFMAMSKPFRNQFVSIVMSWSNACAQRQTGRRIAVGTSVA